MYLIIDISKYLYHNIKYQKPDVISVPRKNFVAPLKPTNINDSKKFFNKKKQKHYKFDDCWNKFNEFHDLQILYYHSCLKPQKRIRGILRNSKAFPTRYLPRTANFEEKNLG